MDKGDKVLKTDLTVRQQEVVSIATKAKKTDLLDDLGSASYNIIKAADISAIRTAINKLEASFSGNCCESNKCQTCQSTSCQSRKCQSCQGCQSCQSQECQSCQSNCNCDCNCDCGDDS